MRLKIALTMAVLFAECATAPAANPVPADPTFDRMWASDADGFIYAAWYFTPEQEQSPAWEAVRTTKHATAEFCDGEKLVHRDVRWFDPQVAGGSKCAKIVYSYSCPVRRPEWGSSLAFERDQALLDEPSTPMPADCGEKDYSKSPHTREPMGSGIELTDGHSECQDMPPDQTTGKFRLLDVNYVRTRTLMSPRYQKQISGPYHNNPASFISAAAREEQKRHFVIVDHALPADDTNISLDEVFTSWGENGYCVTLTAKQGQTVWRRTIKRTSLPKRMAGMVDQNTSHSNHPETYWDQYTDSHLLQHELVTYIGLALPKGHPRLSTD